MRIRYRALLLSLCTLAILPLAVGSASAQNLLTNPGFETGDFTGWEVFGAPAATGTVLATDNGPSAPGTHHAFLDNQAEALALLLKQSTGAGSAIAGPASYSVDLNVVGAGVGAVVFIQVFAEQSGGGVIGGSGLLGPFFPEGGWIVVAGSFPAPVGTDFLTIQIEAVTAAESGSFSQVRVDNVSLEAESLVPTDATSWGRLKMLYN